MADGTQFVEVGQGPDARRIAVLIDHGRPPTLLWLGGFNSEMTATKASALASWARARGRSMVRFDYSGHGRSEGILENGTISRWLEEAEAMVIRVGPSPLIVIGSSMGGWIALLLARRLSETRRADILRGQVLIAPALDMTERLMWRQFSEEQRSALLRDGFLLRPTQYGPDPYPISRRLIEDGRQHLFGTAPIPAPCPTWIVHGQCDPDVPWRLSLELLERLSAPTARLTLVKDGDHRLSRPQDIEVLLAMIESL